MENVNREVNICGWVQIETRFDYNAKRDFTRCKICYVEVREFLERVNWRL